MAKKTAAPKDTALTLECTINLHKRLLGCTFKKRAPRAVKQIKDFATKTMRTQDVRIDTALNKFLWHRGVRRVPDRVRVRLARMPNTDEDAKEATFCLVTHIPVQSFADLGPQKVDSQ